MMIDLPVGISRVMIGYTVGDMEVVTFKMS